MEFITRADYNDMVKAISERDLSFRRDKQTKDKKWRASFHICESRYKDIWKDGMFVSLNCSSSTEGCGIGYSFGEILKMGYEGFRDTVYGHCHIPIPDFEELSIF